MPEPTPQPADEPSWIGKLIAALGEWRPIAKDFVITLGVFATLGTGIWNSCQSARHTDKLQTIENKTDKAAVKAEVAAQKATEVEGVTLKNQVATDKILVNTTGAPADEKALVESKAALAEHQAATREAAQQTK